MCSCYSFHHLLYAPVTIFPSWFCLHLPYTVYWCCKKYLPWYLLLISTIMTGLGFFADVVFNSRVWPYIHTSASLSVSASLPLPSLSPHGPKGLRSKDAHQRGAEEEEVPSVNTKCFELVRIDNTKWPNNPWVFPENPLSSWCNRIYFNVYCRFYTLSLLEQCTLLCTLSVLPCHCQKMALFSECPWK